jgi:hypothetical protein
VTSSYHTTVEFPDDEDIIDVVILDNQGEEYAA